MPRPFKTSHSNLEHRFAELLEKLGLEIPKGARRPIAQDQRLAEEIMDAFLDNSGQQLVDLLRGKSGEDPLSRRSELPLHQMEAVVSLFYSTIQDIYIGVDSHPPSRFLQVHPFLLGNLEASEAGEDKPVATGGHEECHAPRLVRIVPLSPDQLVADLRGKNSDLAQRYFEEHVKRGVTLLCVDPEKQAQAREAVLSGEWTGDLGLWVNTCALLFEANIEPANDKLRLELVYPHDERLENYKRYVSRLVDKAEVVRLHGDRDIKTVPIPPDLKEHLLWSLETMFQPALADVWDEFVSPSRRVSKLGPFVEEQIAGMGLEKATILDAAMGVGCDSTYLASQGHSVIGNEIDARLIAHALEFAEREESEPIEVKRFDWRHFEDLAEAETFDVVLALGNSLSCLDSIGDVRAVLTRFAHLLRPKGLLILDERNYPVMFEHRREMSKADFRFPGKVVYCSNTIRARPSHIPDEAGVDKDLLTLEYLRSRGGKPVGTFKVLPFAPGQLRDLLEDSGFRSVNEYYNLAANGKREAAQFITYVASRTYDVSELLRNREEIETVIAFTDITGSTDAKTRLGARVYAEEWKLHEQRVRRLVKKASGHVANSPGDGFLLSFRDPTAALDCLEAIVGDPGTKKLSVRAGLTKGKAIQDSEGNLRGRDVDVAARICDEARPNLVVADDHLKVSQSLREWESLGQVELKGAGGRNLWKLTR
jgi:class 3 adenylate cyclase/2-polyprenyl-3-methyl-5-hydroxy-6-metoxy-1,4-benzoquinol methylase